jgi:hypothetical protein
MTQQQIDQQIAKVQEAEFKGEITWQELEAHLEAIANELRKEGH